MAAGSLPANALVNGIGDAVGQLVTDQSGNITLQLFSYKGGTQVPSNYIAVNSTGVTMNGLLMDVSQPTDGQVLTYDSATTRIKFKPVSGGTIDPAVWQAKSEKGQASGYASLDGTTKVPLVQIPTMDTAHIPDLSATYQVVSAKNQASGYVGLDASKIADATAFRATRTAGAAAFAGQFSGDSQYRWIASADGILSWGPGGSTAPDTNLYRSAAGVLTSDGALLLKAATSALRVGSSGSDATQSGVLVSLYNDPFWRFTVRYDGRLLWGSGAAAADTALYRAAANQLATQGELWVDGPYTGFVTANWSGLRLSLVNIGFRQIAVDSPDSGGSGYRRLICQN